MYIAASNREIERCDWPRNQGQTPLARGSSEQLTNQSALVVVSTGYIREQI